MSQMPPLIEQLTRKGFVDGGFVDFAWGATKVLNEGVLKPFQMTFSTYFFDYENLQKVSQAIQSGKIWVYYDGPGAFVKSGPGEALYMPDIDVMFTNFSNINNFWYNGILVHESLHAACDERLDCNTANKNTLECIAFTGQCLYYRLKGYKGTKRTDFSAIPDVTSKGLDVFEAAFALADFCIKDPWGRSATLETKLSKAVEALPGYEKFRSVIATDYDGLKRAVPPPAQPATLPVVQPESWQRVRTAPVVPKPKRR